MPRAGNPGVLISAASPVAVTMLGRAFPASAGAREAVARRFAPYFASRSSGGGRVN